MKPDPACKTPMEASGLPHKYAFCPDFPFVPAKEKRLPLRSLFFVPLKAQNFSTDFYILRCCGYSYTHFAQSNTRPSHVYKQFTHKI
ncbi:MULTISPECIES: hypothetical protein [Heyndrickxia]|jgi:hypothetical protein|uniref:hypothetical protein n=1 Tax=Heyndrickxia TaxID=2837504 RepID=UPI001C52C623|nr:hypothetical protein [Heyndrickxia coagulans]